MVPNNVTCNRIGAGTIMLFLFGLFAGLQADEINPLKLNRLPTASRTLSFPSGQCMGNLHLEPESGPGWSARDVRLNGEWEHFVAAQGDVLVREGRNVKLFVRLALSPRESARFLAQNPQAHQQTVADRIRKDPYDLSGLSQLDPNDLFWLSVSTEMYRRSGADPRIFESISHLTGLEILTLFSTGITDEGLEHLRPLRSLKGLELMETSIGSRGLAVLKDLPALEYLQLGTGATDADLKQIAQVSSLRWLNIVGGRMWGPGLAELAKLPRLERLCFWGAGSISDRHIKYLEGLTQLKGLTFNGADALTDASLASIGKLKNLEELQFIRSRPKFTPSGMAHLKNLKNLKTVDFAQAGIGHVREYYGDEVVQQLAANLPNLESIQGINCLTAEGMKTLMAFRNLKYLHVALKNQALGYYGPTGVSHLAGLGSLEELHVSNAESFSEADFASLKPLGRLKKLLVGSNYLSERSLASIGKLKQLERLYLGSPVTRNGLNQLNGLSNLHDLSVTVMKNPAKTYPVDELMLDLSRLQKMKTLYLGGLPLHDSDLAFLKHMPLLENLQIHPDVLTGAFFRHISELLELNLLRVSGLSDCTGEDLAHLNGLLKLRSLHLTGDITSTALASLTGPLCLESFRVETDEPIPKQTVADLTKSHPVIEFIHVHELPRVQTRPVPSPKHTRVSQPRTNRRAPASRRRERR